MPQPIPGSVWSRFEGDRLRDRHQTMFEDLGQRLQETLMPAPVPGPGPAPPGPAFPDFESLMSPFRPSQAAAPTPAPSPGIRTPTASESIIPASGGFALPSLDTLLSGFRPPAAAAATTAPSTETPPGGASTSAAGMPSGPAPAPTGDLRSYARAVALRRGIDPDIFERQIQQESGFNPKAVSPAGAQGIGQFMPATARAVGLADPFEPYSALDAAARHMAENLDANAGDYARALAAYNAGQGAVNKHGGVPPFAETQQYIRTILGDARPTRAAAAAATTSTSPIRPSVAPEVVSNAVASPAGGVPVWGTYTKDTLVPNQLTQGREEGLTTEEALAICGPAAAVAFARTAGRNPTLREAKELGQRLGVWDASVGMRGPASQVTLLANMGIPSRLQEGVSWDGVRRELAAGRPVILDSPGHYWVATAAYPDGTFEFGQSAGVLKASRGRTRFRPDEIPSLGMGDIRASIYMGGQSSTAT